VKTKMRLQTRCSEHAREHAHERIAFDSTASDLWSGEWLSRLASSPEAVTLPQPLTRM
jgi:hypothetical protein